ncbi:MAG: CRISPR-associated protein Cas4 [Methanoregula sp.]|nr:CRISPR-associated protein Cas4 [Methanoregula sp.]
MFQIVLTWNLSEPSQHIGDLITDINIRGYRKKDILLPSEYRTKLRNHEIKPLSVGDIVDKICPTRRNVYYRKGVSPPDDVPNVNNWGSKAGTLVEKYLMGITNDIDINPQNYSNIAGIGNGFHDDFKRRKKNRNALDKLISLERPGEIGNTDWLQSLLSCNIRAELAAKILHSLLHEDGVIDFSHIQPKRRLHPNVQDIGVSDDVEPDFIIPDFGIVGDIKTGIQFQPYHQLTCAGYALAYESEMRKKPKKRDINWGIVYFIQTRLESDFVKSLTTPQIYIFPIDNNLRESFKTLRNEMYRITSGTEIPDFPEYPKKEDCRFCKFFDYCKTLGLVWP